jgi:BMFP domain-containing protein YqiC
MIDAKTLDEFTRKLVSVIPQSVFDVQRDVEKNLRAVLEALFQKLDLVTREEYEVQAALLERSRARLKALEERISELEKATGSLHSITQKD